MLGRFVWVVMMGVMAACCLFIGITDSYQRFNTSSVQMKIDPAVGNTRKKMLEQEIKQDPFVISTPVLYTFADGKTLLEADARLRPDELQRLLKGDTLLVYYNPDYPHAVYDRDELPQPAGWLIGGVVLSAVTWLAARLFRKESEGY